MIIRFKELEAAIQRIMDEHELDFNIQPKVVGSLCTGEVLYVANLGTAKHPCWIYGTKDSVTSRIKEFNVQILNQLKNI